eukprot:4199703-Lingulodinium_polyedra.AAC.1
MDSGYERDRVRAEKELFELRARLHDELWELDLRADAISRRAVRIDGLTGADARPSVIAAVLTAVGSEN